MATRDPNIYETEPLVADHAMLALPNTALTPHVARGTHAAFRARTMAIIANVERLRTG